MYVKYLYYLCRRIYAGEGICPHVRVDFDILNSVYQRFCIWLNETSQLSNTNNIKPMRKLVLLLTFVVCTSLSFTQGNFKDVRQTYLWDVTLSMKGYNGVPDIYEKVVDVMVKDIESIKNDRTEIVVIPFQNTKYCEVWKEMATPDGKKAIISKIKSYNNDKKTRTCISEPLQYSIDSIFSADKIDIMKLMTDGNDNVNPNKLHDILSSWCEIAKIKDVYGYYILLTNDAKNGDLSLELRGVCNFEEVDVTDGNFDGIAQIIQETPSFAEGISINIRDEYNKPKRLEFSQYMGDTAPTGFKVRFKTKPNPYIEIDTVAEMQSDNSMTIHPRFLESQEQLIQNLPKDDPYSDIILEYKPAEDMHSGKFKFTRLMDGQCNISLINKPEKTVRIYVKK